MAHVKREDELQGTIIHEYDGIEEADNDLPQWWLLLFFVTIVFSVGYWFVYEEFRMALQPHQAYTEALAREAAAGGRVSEPLLLALLEDSTSLARGQEIWTVNCVNCHKSRGEGQIGPNLTDRYWLHGGSPVDIHNTIRDGVDNKGMQSWLPALGARGVQQVTAYVLTLRNTEVPGKEPEGELWDPIQAQAASEEPSDEEASSQASSGDPTPDAEAVADPTPDNPTPDSPTPGDEAPAEPVVGDRENPNPAPGEGTNDPQ